MEWLLGMGQGIVPILFLAWSSSAISHRRGQPVWLYSLIYNGSYIIPETIITILLLQILLRRLYGIWIPGRK